MFELLVVILEIVNEAETLQGVSYFLIFKQNNISIRNSWSINVHILNS